FFSFHALASSQIYTLSLHDALPIYFQFAFEILAVQGIVDGGADGKGGFRSLVLRVERVAYSNSRTECPASQKHRQSKPGMCIQRSEERRVGKECRARGGPESEEKKE